MSADTKFRYFVDDMIKEINRIALDVSIWGDTEFERGYRGGLMAILKVVEDEIRAFEINSADISENLINVDEWFRNGADYTTPNE